ncbi:hypothetical protein MMC29_005593 [Sticta canariensis]|nr:hypothetical protein [Sticta canariensis]
MISFTLIAILSTTLALVCAQVVVDPTTGRITCPVSAGPTSLAYCAGESLVTNIIIRCRGTFGQPGNCNDNLAGIPPVGVKYSPCYQSSPLAGDAACSYDGIAYPDNGSPFRIPSNVNTSTSSFTAISTSDISTPVPVSYGPRETPTTAVVYAIDRSYILQNLERKGLPGVFKRDNTTSLQGTTGNTAAVTGTPVQTGASTSPFSSASNIKEAGTWVIGFITLALTALMV